MSYTFDGNYVIRDDGFIAVQHRNSNPTALRISGITYQFTAKHNVSMSWISPDHINKVLGEMARQCCGTQGKKFLRASLINVNLHETGNRDGA
jgi:hypothetical protein